MSIFNVLRGQFIDIIEWNEPPQNDILAYRFPRFNNEIKMGAKLVVREEAECALFVNEAAALQTSSRMSPRLTVTRFPRKISPSCRR